MTLTARDKGGGEDWEPVSAKVHHAICIAIWDLGTQFNERFGKWAEKCVFMWEVPGETVTFTNKEDVEVTMPKVITREFSTSLHQKSHMRPFLENWRGRPFTAEDLDGFSIKACLGANCMIQVMHNTRDDGKVWHEVTTIMPIQPGVPKLDPQHETSMFEIPVSGPRPTIPDKTPGWIIKKIEKSKEFRGDQTTDNTGDYGYTPPPVDTYEDDIPF